MTSGKSSMSEADWIQSMKEAALADNLPLFRSLLDTEHAKARPTPGMDPNNDEHLKLIMKSMRRHIQEGENFRRSVASEGLEPKGDIEKMALQAGVTPETLIKGSFSQGKNNERK